LGGLAVTVISGSNVSAASRICLRSSLCLVTATCVLLAIAVASANAQGTSSRPTLDAIKERNNVRCGVPSDVPGFASEDANGVWTGFTTDVCRAFAAAIFDDPSKVTFIPLTVETGFAPLVSREIDVLARVNTWTLSREAGLGIQFAFVSYYDGQGFMVRKSRGAASARDLGGTKVCVQRQSTSELNLADYFSANDLKYEEVVLSDPREILAAYDEGRCDVYQRYIAALFPTAAVEDAR
jgi:general L-amino acid transport system substrate-binding protein